MSNFQQNLKQFVKDNPKLVTMKETRFPGVFVLKYTRRVFYDSLWNEYLEHCRGTLVDEDFNIVSYPLKKIYNYGVEKECPEFDLEREVWAHRKINGFMVAMTYHNDELIVSTTGSTDSEYVEMAKEFITDQIREYLKKCDGYTAIFECVHRNDPHIIPEKEGLYILGISPKNWDIAGRFLIYSSSVLIGEICPTVKMPEHFTLKLKDLIELSKKVKHEGFVFYQYDKLHQLQQKSAKIKSPYYLVSKAIARKKDIFALNKEFIDEEYYPLINHLKGIQNFNDLDEQERLKIIRNYLENV